MDIYTHPFWYVFMTAVLASMTAIVICYTLAQAARAIARHFLARTRGGQV